ncbi:hypothetical protein GCM10007304_05900 [Rhodococcoides trifolii]|uniref:Uncharacterized protein n=1 Tax=Rhodococcoides trifolii TaxID=908250 RepID=A0A917CPK6_9NOCA|nr:hypothetical protein [Rhodococcus trifolii]GGF94859.1 hypothetical protein GCM10007304_05900 [Rhodococcus trifolii]
MFGVNTGQLALVRAIFSDEFATDGVDYDALIDIAQGDITDWIADLHHTGLFTSTELDAMTCLWRRDPAALASILLGSADDRAARRGELALAGGR